FFRKRSLARSGLPKESQAVSKSLVVLNSAAASCGTCAPHGCSSCSPSPQQNSPSIVTRRGFGYATLVSAGLLLTGCTKNETPVSAAQPLAPAAAPPLSPDLAVVQQSKGPIMTTLEEFYKMGPGPSSSHTMGPMRITYDFFQRVSKLPDDQLKRATALKVHLF